MRKLIVPVMLSFLASTAIEAQEQEKKPETLAERVSYGIGLNLGKSLKSDGVPVSIEFLMKGIAAAIAGEDSLLSEEEIRLAMTELQDHMRQRQAMQAQENVKAGEEFLAKNKDRAGVIALPSGLQYEVLEEGNGPKPKVTDSVSVNYRGTLLDGTQFDSSYESGRPATFATNRVIPGWTEALQLMKVGSKWKLFIPANLAYGMQGFPPDIGPNSTLLFEIELLGIER